MKKKNWIIRILAALLFLGLSGLIALSIYTLSAEDGYDSSDRSQYVTEALKEEVQYRLENSEEGLELSEYIRSMVIRFSPYGSNWNLNIRKLAHFTIYCALGAMIYITLAILGCGKIARIFLTLFLCGLFAVFDEIHQGSVLGRTMSKKDVVIDFLGACSSVAVLTGFSIIYTIIAKISKVLFNT